MLVLSMLTTHEKRREVAPGKFFDMSRLPDELVVQILATPFLDLKTLCHVARTCKRFYALVLRVLVQHRLPHIQLATVMDQEGRGRSTSHFRFFSLDKQTLCATFAVQSMTPRRYRSEAEFPTLRHMSVTDSLLSTKITPTWTQSKDKKREWKPKRDAGMGKSSIRQRKISTKRDGVQVIESFSTFFSRQQRRLVWRLTYFVSRDEDARLSRRQNFADDERYVAPMYLTVHLSLLSRDTDAEAEPSSKWIQTVHNWFRSKPNTVEHLNLNKR